MELKQDDASKKANAYKDEGNKAFASKNYLQAAKYYTEAIKLDPKNHIFYSNRSASLFQLSQFEEALADANECIKLSPNFAKGYFRKGKLSIFFNSPT